MRVVYLSLESYSECNCMVLLCPADGSLSALSGFSVARLHPKSFPTGHIVNYNDCEEVIISSPPQILIPY